MRRQPRVYWEATAAEIAGACSTVDSLAKLAPSQVERLVQAASEGGPSARLLEVLLEQGETLAELAAWVQRTAHNITGAVEVRRQKARSMACA